MSDNALGCVQGSVYGLCHMAGQMILEPEDRLKNWIEGRVCCLVEFGVEQFPYVFFVTKPWPLNVSHDMKRWTKLSLSFNFFEFSKQ